MMLALIMCAFVTLSFVYKPLAQRNYAEVHIYRRVSTANQTDDRQKHNLRWAYKEYPDAIHHFDNGFSGSDRNRPSLNQMKGFLNVKTHMPKLLIVDSIDRLYRDMTGFLQFIERYILQDNLHLYFNKENMLLTSANAMDENQRTLYVMLAHMAEMERLRIARRTKEKLDAKKARGETLGRPRDTSHDLHIHEHFFQGLSAWKSARLLRISLGKVQRARKELGLGNDDSRTTDEEE